MNEELRLTLQCLVSTRGRIAMAIRHLATNFQFFVAISNNSLPDDALISNAIQIFEILDTRGEV